MCVLQTKPGPGSKHINEKQYTKEVLKTVETCTRRAGFGGEMLYTHKAKQR
jgi:hypothetical protein